MTGGRYAQERGSVTILGASILTLFVIIGTLVAATFATAWDVTRTRNTVDLAAISAAQVLADGGSESEACAAAQEIGDVLEVSCSVEGRVARIVGEKDAKFLWIADRISASAVAGPARKYSQSPPR